MWKTFRGDEKLVLLLPDVEPVFPGERQHGKMHQHHNRHSSAAQPPEDKAVFYLLGLTNMWQLW